MEDSIVKELTERFKQRSETGIMKYGVTLDRKDLDLKQWLHHLLEEQMDACLYTLRAIKKVEEMEVYSDRLPGGL